MIQRWSKKTKQTIAAIGITLMICSLTALIGWTVVQRQWLHERALYEREIERLNEASAPAVNQQVTSQVWQFTGLLQAGDVITTEDVELVRLDTSIVPAGGVKEKEEIIGKVVKIDVGPRMVIVPSILSAPDVLDHDIRWIETAVIQLPLQLKTEDVLDIRIRFPNGLDYVLIAHKKVLDLQKPTMWMQMSEQELLMLSSAYVDAFLHGGQLYAVRYVDPMVQNGAIVNYPVREDVLQLIKKDPNIIQKAQAALSEQSRKVLEQQLKEYRVEDVSNEVSMGMTGSPSTASNGSLDPLHHSPFTGLAPQSQAQSPFVGEASTQAEGTQQTSSPLDNPEPVYDLDATHSQSIVIESPPQQTNSFIDPNQSYNPSTTSMEMKTSQSQTDQSHQP